MDLKDLDYGNRDAVERVFYQCGVEARVLANFFHQAVANVDDTWHLQTADLVRRALHRVYGTRRDGTTAREAGPVEIMAGMHQFLADIGFNPEEPGKETVRK